MNRIKCAVIGVGYLGRFHAQKYAALDNAELVAVVDIDDQAAQRSARDCGCRALTDYREVIGEVDAVSIAVPTVRHYDIARDFLEAGVHVLLEKPIASTLDEAKALTRLARERGVIFQIGHLERFNAAFLDLGGFELNPLFIESHRVAPFKPRGTDVNVVLDLMIHDIDLILGMVKSPVRSLAANGTPVLSDELDIVNARLEFENGCVANVTSSRVSVKSERRMRIFQPEAYISIDFQSCGLAVHRIGDREMFPGVPEILREESSFEENDALRREIESFVSAVRDGTPVVVTGEDGLRALETAMHISAMVDSRPKTGAVRSA
ncbi:MULTISPECIES: Gfo/Idh/MocA family protein [unclassified Wenzhouxiangella]|uniref:Gfo/Idh/MocA family protein n=1 Tax=unclassified Wenzhouxiangella TaxID=2613841 RepID=UPI000E32A839|nr:MULTISPECIES: Gfo/Idh/MocA family oxidoreductase [unclassified Wenzhouxiangella]RFF26302.1 gfo/Idh/MocA family oxidoreductase [Wenzhouxiangella sp. 15181]RFP67427.1 gfo/Idh/MocA family oxidoreductase [Wenzhouxiangella sp. 15190]